MIACALRGAGRLASALGLASLGVLGAVAIARRLLEDAEVGEL